MWDKQVAHAVHISTCNQYIDHIFRASRPGRQGFFGLFHVCRAGEVSYREFVAAAAEFATTDQAPVSHEFALVSVYTTQLSDSISCKGTTTEQGYQ